MQYQVFITQKALTEGIIEAKMELTSDGSHCRGIVPGSSFPSTYYGEDFHLSRSAAIEQANKMRDVAISNLTKQIEKLQALHF